MVGFFNFGIRFFQKKLFLRCFQMRAPDFQCNPLFRLVSTLYNAVIIREVGLGVKILVLDESPVRHRHLLDAVEREGEESAVFQASEQLPATAEGNTLAHLGAEPSFVDFAQGDAPGAADGAHQPDVFLEKCGCFHIRYLLQK